MTKRDTDLAELQNQLTKLLLAEPRDLPAIIEAADAVRRAERQCLANENLGFASFAGHPAGVQSTDLNSQPRPGGGRARLHSPAKSRPVPK